MHPKTRSLIHISSDVAAFAMSQMKEDSGVPSLNENVYGFCYPLQGFFFFFCAGLNMVCLQLCAAAVRLVAEEIRVHFYSLVAVYFFSLEV